MIYTFKNAFICNAFSMTKNKARSIQFGCVTYKL